MKKSVLERTTLTWFCGICNLQPGVVFTFVVLIVLYTMSMFAVPYRLLMFDGWTGQTYPLVVIFTHGFFVITGCITALIGAYYESSGLMIYAGISIFVAIILYTLASIVSYIPSLFNYSCSQYFCPDHLWLAPSLWRLSFYSIRSADDPLGSTEMPACAWAFIQHPYIDLIISIIFNLSFFLFLCYTALTYCSFAAEVFKFPR